MNASGGREALIRSKLEGPTFIGGYDVSGKKHWHLGASADALYLNRIAYMSENTYILRRPRRRHHPCSHIPPRRRCITYTYDQKSKR